MPLVDLASLFELKKEMIELPNLQKKSIWKRTLGTVNKGAYNGI
ncbi:hypothetical protein [Neobacillus niacini]